MNGFDFGGSHSEVMAACKLAGLSGDSTCLKDILANKTEPQVLAGLEAFFTPQILAKESDFHWWDTHMRDITKEPLSGMVWLHLQQHTHIACKLTPMCWPAPRICQRSSLLHPSADLQQDLKMVRLSASTCAKLLQAAGRLHSSLLGNLPDASKATLGSIKPSPLAPSPAASGPADSKAAAERQEGQSLESAKLACAAWSIYDYCMEAGHKLAQSDAHVVWDLHSTPGTNVHC